MGLIEVNSLTTIIQGVSILKNINLSIEAGKFYALLGPNGSGKTTLIRSLTSDITISKGTIVINGKALKKYSRKELSRIISIVPQNTNVAFSFSVYDVVMMGRSPYLRFFEDEKNEDKSIVEEAMKITGVWELRNRDITKISGGERQRAIIARAIAQKTPIIMLDEPISNLDMFHQIEVMNTLKNLCKSGVTVVASLHDLNIAARYCDICALMSKGEVISADTPSNIFTVENIKKTYQVETIILESPVGLPLVVAR